MAGRERSRRRTRLQVALWHGLKRLGRRLRQGFDRSRGLGGNFAEVDYFLGPEEFVLYRWKGSACEPRPGGRVRAGLGLGA